jgi:hypothetical protein
MLMHSQSLTWTVFGLSCLSGDMERQAVALQRTWIGGNVDWVDGAAGNANWSPADEPEAREILHTYPCSAIERGT